MVDPKNRLCKLINECSTYDQFFKEAVSRSSWVLKPYAEMGHLINKPWLENFWKTHKPKM